MIKDLFGIFKDWGVKPLVYAMGWFGCILFGLSLIPSLSFIPKFFVLFVLTH